jgi:MoaA/NifB/PqqE/SkfB family radical SAM enzyme
MNAITSPPTPLRDFQSSSKIFSHLDRVQELKESGDTRPVHITLGLTNFCNHKCPWCYINWTQAGASAKRSGNYTPEATKPKILATERLIQALAEAKDLGLKAVTIVGDGEPTLHPKFIAYLQAIKDLGLDIGIFSNLSFADKKIVEALCENCFFVRGSIDACTKETHKITHGSDDFDKVISNLKTIITYRNQSRLKRPVVGVQYVVNQFNYRQVADAAKFYKDLGVDYMSIKPAYKNKLNPDHPENEIDLKETFALMQRAEQEQTETFKVYAKYPQFLAVVGQGTNDAKYYKKCYATPLSPYLDEDGNLEMCGNLKGRGFTMGNVIERSFGEIWKSAQRRACLDRIDLFQCPAGCKLDPLNKVLWDAFHPDIERVHPNFT